MTGQRIGVLEGRRHHWWRIFERMVPAKVKARRHAYTIWCQGTTQDQVRTFFADHAREPDDRPYVAHQARYTRGT